MLSDECFELINDIRAASHEGIQGFLENLDHYGTPPYDYPPEDIQALRDAAIKALEPDALEEDFIQLLTLAHETRVKYDTPPL